MVIIGYITAAGKVRYRFENLKDGRRVKTDIKVQNGMG